MSRALGTALGPAKVCGAGRKYPAQVGLEKRSVDLQGGNLTEFEL